MRSRAIQEVPGLDVASSPFDRFRQFAKRIVSVPKEEADMGIKKKANATRGSVGKDRSNR
jgi:hypothetical protein